MPIEVITAILVTALGIATLVAAYVGILGLVGALVIQRCARCGHMCIRASSPSPDGCGYCRHDRLLHPLWAFRHAHTAYWAGHKP